MPEPIVIDSHVHVGRNQARWSSVRPALEAVGIDTAVLSPDPDSHDLRGERGIGGELARPGGPYGLWYIGGSPFAGYRSGEALLPPSLDDYDGVDWHCWFSAGYDYGGSGEAELADARAFLESSVSWEALTALEAAVAARLPVRLTESLAFTLALLESFPLGTFIVPHLGLRNGGVSRVLNALAERRRTLFDSSLVEPNEGIVALIGAERMLLGSDAPNGEPGKAVRDVRNLHVAPDDMAAILGENARRLFRS